MLTNLRRAGTVLDWVFMGISLALLAVIIISSFIQVFTRYVMGSAVTGTEELGRYCFIWMSMLGGSICVGKWLHPSISILTDKLQGDVKRWLDLFLCALIIVVAAVLVAKGINMVQVTTRQLSSVMRIPMSYVYLSVPLGGFGMGYHALVRIVASLRRPAGEGEQ